MDLTDAERDMITAALDSRRYEQELRRRLRRERLAEHQRREQADRSENERFVRGLLVSTGIDPAEAQQRRERNTADAAEFLQRQRGIVVDRSGAIAQRQQATARAHGARLAAEQRSGAAGAYALTTVDTAAAIWPVHAAPDANNQVDVVIDPPAPMTNVANVWQSKLTTPDIRYHLPGIWEVDIHWAFRFPVPDNVLLNAVTFVQALGADSLYASGWFFGSSYARIEFSTRLDLFAVGPPPLQQIRAIGTGDQDQGPDRLVRSEWWDLLGQFDSSVYDFQSTLIDNGLSPVRAGSTVFILVSASLDLTADGNAFCVADFFNGDLQINVPAVYVSTFPDNPIP
jgi:hypothetical protein